MDVVRRRALVSGRVQGVWYRDSCQREARRLGLGGWVRNREDGRVELAAEGDPDAVATLLEWARIGPPRAVVVSLEVIEESPAGDTTFRITP